MTKPTPEQLLDIARHHLNSTLTTLETRNHDSLDFHEVSCWGIRQALQAAYALGAKEAKGEA